MYFHLQIKNDSDELLFNSLSGITNEFSKEIIPIKLDDETEEDNNFLKEKLNCLQIFMDEFKMSKLLKNSLKRMKKGEYSEILCNDLKLINKGIDAEILKNMDKKPEFLLYLIKLYYFTEGKNTFTMSVDEKIENAKRKKEIGLELIKKGEYKRGLKCFENTNSYFELGQFTIEENQRINEVFLILFFNFIKTILFIVENTLFIKYYVMFIKIRKMETTSTCL